MVEPNAAVAKVGAVVGRGLILTIWRRWRPDTSHAALERQADDLADKVRPAETEHLQQLRVTRGHEVALYYEAHARVRGAGGEDLGALSKVWDYYRKLEPTRRLVVLGEPGSGKTVLALHLLLDLLDHRRDELGAPQPVPVRLNATSWNVETPFSSWLAASLARDYGRLPLVARKLVETERVVPVLDGLDEMDPPGCSRSSGTPHCC